MSLVAKISPQINKRSTHVAGIGLMLLAVFVFSVGDAIGKFVLATYAIGQFLWLRACAALILLAPVIWRHKEDFTKLEQPALQLLRVAFATSEVASFFIATKYLPLADVVTYYLACPIFVTALSAMVFREKVGYRRWSAILIGFVGVLIALHPSAESFSWPALIALCGSLSFAGFILTTRQLRKTPDVVMVASQFAGSFLFGAALAPIGWIMPTAQILLLFAAAGMISVCALLCVSRSLKLAPASAVIPYQYSQIFWAVTFGFIVFGDMPSPAMLLGALIIVGAGLYIFLRERKLDREHTAVGTPG